MRGRGERQQGRSGPAERAHDGQREKIAGPSEVASHICFATKQANSYGGKSAGQKQREQQERDARELPSQR